MPGLRRLLASVLLAALALTAAKAAAQPVVLHEVETFAPLKPTLGVGSDAAFVLGNLYVAAAGNSDRGPSAGAVLRFARSGPDSPFVQLEKIYTPQARSSLYFGQRVDAALGVRGEALMAVSAHYEHDEPPGGPFTLAAGAVYVYDVDADGLAGPPVRLAADFPVSGERMGSRIAIDISSSGARVASVSNVSAGIDPRLGYVFERAEDSGTWAQQVRLLAPHRDLVGGNGSSWLDVALRGDYLLYGLEGADSDTTEAVVRDGAALLYRRDATTGAWELADLWASPDPPYPDPDEFRHHFGFRVALAGPEDNPVAFVETNGYLEPGGRYISAVYVFERDIESDTWKRTDVLLPSDHGDYGLFGYSLDVVETPVGLLLLAGDPDESGEGGASLAGAAFVYRRDPEDGSWEYLARLRHSAPSCCQYLGGARPVLVEGDQVLVGHNIVRELGMLASFQGLLFDIGGLLPVSSENGPEPVPLVSIETIWPNPSSSSASVGYRLGAAGPVVVSVLDLLGREVARVVEREQSAGWHGALIETGGLAPGVYAVRVEAGGSRAVRRLVVAR